MNQAAANTNPRLVAIDLLAFVLLAAATGVAAGIALAGITLLFAGPA